MEKRWPASSLMHLVLDEEIPGGASFAYTLGSAVFTIFILQAVTGILQLFFYAPTIDHAYDSVSFIRTKVPFGWLIHGIHYWGANIMVVLVLLHMTRVFIFGAYKNPRELTWLAGVTLFLTTMAFTFTGSPLPWDQRGYWIGEVSTSIAGTAPVFGDIMKNILRGGEEMGQLALSRLFALHTSILPAALIGLFLIHIVAMRRFGVVGPWKEEKRETKGPFWPDQAFKDMVMFAVVFLALITFTVFIPPSYSGQADQLDTSYIPKPDWNFLFLYESLKYFQGKLEPIGTVGVPTVLIMILILLPFLDRNPERNPFRRPVVMTGAFIIAAIVIAISLKGYFSPGFGQVSPPSSGNRSAVPMFAVLESDISPSSKKDTKTDSPAPSGTEKNVIASEKGLPGKAAYIIGSAERGEILFKRQCSPCHGEHGKKGIPNPGSSDGKVPELNPIDREIFDSDPEVFAANIDRFIQHGSLPEGPEPALRMAAFGDTNSLTQQEISNLEAYILRLNGVDRGKILNPGIDPNTFYIILVGAYVLFALILAGLWNKKRNQVS